MSDENADEIPDLGELEGNPIEEFGEEELAKLKEANQWLSDYDVTSIEDVSEDMTDEEIEEAVEEVIENADSMVEEIDAMLDDDS